MLSNSIKTDLNSTLPLWSPNHQKVKNKLLERIVNIRISRLQTILADHLYGILPVNEVQRGLLPILLISVASSRIFPFRMVLQRKKSQQLKIDSTSSKLSAIEKMAFDLQTSALYKEEYMDLSEREKELVELLIRNRCSQVRGAYGSVKSDILLLAGAS